MKRDQRIGAKNALLVVMKSDRNDDRRRSGVGRHLAGTIEKAGRPGLQLLRIRFVMAQALREKGGKVALGYRSR